MRDAHRMKEKLDVSLDNRQIVSLAIGALVVMGAVFVLGVVVGKKLGESDRTANAKDVLSALDEKAAAIERVQAQPTLTFQDELTRKETPEHRDEKPAPAEPKPAAAEMKKPEPASVEAASTAPGKAEPRMVETGKAEEAPRSAPDGSIRTTPTPTRIAEKAPQHVEKPAHARSGFTLQLSATPTREEATAFVAHMKQKGYAPYIVEAQVPGRGTWYRVRMGEFASKDAASRYLQDFRRETQLDAFVAPAN